MLSKQKSGVRRKVLVPLTLTFVVLMVTFVISGYTMRKRGAEDEIRHRYRGVQNLFEELLSQRVGLMTSAIEFIIADEQLIQAFLSGNQSTLLEESYPVFQLLSSRYGITHLYFHDLNGTVRLRVHQPDRFGDTINRFTVRQAVETHQVSHGLELGPLGTFTHRVITPMYFQGKLVGFIELGEEIERLIDKLKTITGTDFMVAIEKQYLDRDRWAQGMRMLGRFADWDLLRDEAIVDYTIENISREELRTLHRVAHEGSTVKIQGTLYQMKGFPLEDAGKERIGDFIVLHDVTAAQTNLKSFIAKTLGISITLCAGLFAFAFAILGRMDRALYKAEQQLKSQISKAEEMNARLESEVAVRKRAEEDLTRLNENLEERVLERTNRLERLNREIEENRKALKTAYEDLKTKQATILHQDKMAGIGQLAAGVAHDINNPIGFVYNNLKSLEKYSTRLISYVNKQADALQSCASKELLKELEGTYKDLKLDFITNDFGTLIEESLEGAARVSKTVKNLHTFSRIDESECRDVDIIECLESTINITRNELRYKAIVKRDYSEVPRVCCFPQQLNQVFMNLLINAAQAIENRGEITVKAWSDEDAVFVAISDTGSGIPEEKLGRIFEPFYTTKDVGKGTGLGLSITYDIIKKHQGEITVDSELGRGTTFTISLPLNRKA